MAYFNGNKWCRKCPDCGKELEYTGTNAKYNARYQEGKLCSSCWQKGDRHPNFGNPAYNKGVPMSEEQKEKLSTIKTGTKRSIESRTKQGNSIRGEKHHNFGTPISDKQKVKLSLALKGRVSPVKGKKWTLQQRARASFVHIGHKPSAESRRKNRMATINYIIKKNGGIRTSFNKKACEYFDELNKSRGWNLQHALNGGEYHVENLGYFIDGYDKSKNIIVEYDEPYHERPAVKDRDMVRQKELIEHMAPKEFWRFSIRENKLICIHKA